MRESEPFEVFISHFAEEKAIAEVLQEYLWAAFGADLRVFRSSDDGSIRTGEDQYLAILKALSEAKVYIALLSKYGAMRPWLNFEVGYGKAREAKILPVLIRGAKESDIPTPLSQLEIRHLSEATVIEDIVQTVSEATGRAGSGNTQRFLGRLRAVESTLPNRELVVMPFRYPLNLAFNLRYNGPRAIKLVKVWAELPLELMDKNWPRRGVTGFLSSETVKHDGKTYLRRELIANTGVPDPRECGAGWSPLHPHYAPNDMPHPLKELRFAIDDDAITQHGHEMIRCQVIAEDGASQVFEYRFDAIEMRKGLTDY
ncbi:MAG: toll/interleukin-1 receptor domain-containing protein [Acidobacteriota bacterium]|nr:toll/interleukin-1 receptor domain-containing protein [Acidobacteriota bacterium]